MLKITITLLLSLVLSSCVASVSSRPEFSALMNSELQTKRKALVSKVPPDRRRHYSATHYLSDYLVGENDGRKEEWVPLGTPLKITGVYKEWLTTGGPVIYVVGLIKEPESGQKVKFRYRWNSASGPYLKRAPWEADSDPRRFTTGNFVDYSEG